MVAIDFNDTVGELLSYAEGMAMKFEAKLWVLHVAAPNPDFVGSEPGPQYERDIQAEELLEAHRNLPSNCVTFLVQELACDALLNHGPFLRHL